MIRGVERNEDLVRLMLDILMDLILIQIRLTEGQLFKWNEWIYIGRFIIMGMYTIFADLP